MRKSAAEPNRYAPVLITAAHTRASDVTKARDCGGHIMVTKPFAPIVVLERIIWIAREGRAFLQSETYTGPDRRIAKNEPPADHPRRRREDAEPSAVAFGGVQTFDQADPSRPIPAAQSAKAAS
jgi:DNA-binding response OmpR family regulator